MALEEAGRSMPSGVLPANKWTKIISDVKTEKGEWINFAIAMQGLDDLTAKTDR